MGWPERQKQQQTKPLSIERFHGCMVNTGVLIEQRIVPWRIPKESSCMPFRALPPWRQRGRCATAREKASGRYYLGPRDHSFHQTVRRLPVANHIFLASWMVHICQECHSLRSAPQSRHTVHLGLCLHSTLRKLSGRD